MALVVLEDHRTACGMMAVLAVAVVSTGYWNYMEDNYSLDQNLSAIIHLVSHKM